MSHHLNNPRSSSSNLRSYYNRFLIDPCFSLGTWSLGGSHFGAYQTSLALEVIQTAYDAGIRHFDSAFFYAKGQSQAILRKALSTKPADSYLISLKAGLRWQGNRVFHDGSSRHIHTAVFEALRFFKREVLDIFLLHWPDPQIDIRVACDTLSGLTHDGKIKFWGLCNIDESHFPLLEGYDYSVCHFHYNPLHRPLEKVMNQVLDKGVIVMGYSPFEQGLLVNPRYSQCSVLSKGDVRNRNSYFCDETIKPTLQRLFQLDTAGFSYSQCILQWLRDQSCLEGVIVGSRYLDHLRYICDFLAYSNDDRLVIKQSSFYLALDTLFTI